MFGTLPLVLLDYWLAAERDVDRFAKTILLPLTNWPGRKQLLGPNSYSV